MAAEFHVDFLGCKVSQTDAESIRDALVAAGHAPAGDTATIQVVNTCCITAEAEAKSRKRVSRAVRAGEDVHVFVTGCGATLAPHAYAELGARVTTLPGAALAGTAGAQSVAAAIVQAADQLPDLGCKGVAAGSVDAPRRSATERTRAFVKVQDGCSFTCSYCIVPTVRGATRSRGAEAVLADVARRVARGQCEIVLTGINIGLYRDPTSRIGLARLLGRVAAADGVVRVRISSIESNHVDRRLVEAIAANPACCPHLHVPLQSGSDRVLADMRRHYDAAGWLRTIERARAGLPDLNLTTDVIVGYPGEDDADAADTLAVCAAAGVTGVHAFPFSPRPGTDAQEAVAAGRTVPREVARARSSALRAAADERARARWRDRVGSRDEVLVERPGTTPSPAVPGAVLTDDHEAAPASVAFRAAGYARDYSPVRMEWSGEPAPRGTVVPVDLVGDEPGGLVGRPA